MTKVILISLVVALAAGMAIWLAQDRNPDEVMPIQRADRTQLKEQAVDLIPEHAAFRKEGKENLSDEQYNVCFLGGTEAPGSGKYYKHFADGTYHCVSCGALLFDSGSKFDSNTGWPAFSDVADNSRVKSATDYDLGYARTEVSCATCGAHLGHIFDDSNSETGQRY